MYKKWINSEFDIIYQRMQLKVNERCVEIMKGCKDINIGHFALSDSACYGVSLLRNEVFDLIKKIDNQLLKNKELKMINEIINNKVCKSINDIYAFCNNGNKDSKNIFKFSIDNINGYVDVYIQTKIRQNNCKQIQNIRDILKIVIAAIAGGFIGNFIKQKFFI